MTVSASFATPIIVNHDFGAVPIVCGQGYSYQAFGGDSSGPIVPQQAWSGTPGFGWNLSLFGDGLTGPNTTFNPPPFGGLPFSQAVFLQGISWVFQDIGGFTAGNYVLSFYLGSRYFTGPYDGNQTVEALLDGSVIGTWTLTSFTPFALENATFTVSTGGIHRPEFDGMNVGDHTAFLSDVSITQTPEPTSLTLLGTAILGFAGILRRKFNL
jgi:hypothetical protein